MNATEIDRRQTARWKLSVLVLLASLVSVTTLAKHSFALPRSSPSHWVSQTCKMREGRRVSSPHVAVLRAIIPILRSAQPRPRVIATCEGEHSPIPIAGFFRLALLRAPPSFKLFLSKAVC